MANCIRSKRYKCPDDCKMEGCPGHEMTLEFQSCSEIYHFTSTEGMDYYFNDSTMQTVIDLIKSLNRADTIKFNS